MSSYTQLLKYLATMCLVVIVLGQQGPAHPPLLNFPSPQRQLEDRVDQLEAKLSISEQRQNAIAGSVTKEMTTLAKDSGALKTTVTRLVEDSVQMMGRIRIMQDVGQDVVDLRKHVANIQKEATDKVSQVQTQVNALSGKLDQLSSASTYITVGLSTQMKQNKDLLKSIQNKLSLLDNKLKTAETKIASMEKSGGSSGSGSEALAGTVSELKESLAAYKTEQASKIAKLEKELSELRSLLE